LRQIRQDPKALLAHQDFKDPKARPGRRVPQAQWDRKGHPAVRDRRALLAPTA
jgi:hypothetical protein